MTAKTILLLSAAAAVRHSREGGNPVAARRQDGYMRDNCCYVYILASKKNGVLYTGVTSSLRRRVCEHKTDQTEGFTKKYHVHKLVYFERYDSIHSAIRREKRIKKWNRDWKIRLIEEANPEWNDLAEGILG